MKLYTLRHRQGNRGVQLNMIELKNPTGDPIKDRRIAEEVGKRYCDNVVNSLFIRVDDAVIADESILDPDVLDRIINPPPPKKRDRPAPPAPAAEPESEGEKKPKFDGNLDKLLDDDEEEHDLEVETEEAEEATDETPAEDVEEPEEEAPAPAKKKGKKARSH